MPSKDFGEDVAFFLYLVPIVASIVYGAYEWAITAKTSAMPSTAYLVVSKSPYLFLLSLVAVCGAIVVELAYSDITERNSIVQANTLRLQVLAVIVLIISLAAAISAGGYNLANGISFFVNGRYALIYAFFLIGISLLLAPKQVLGNAKRSSLPEVVGLILLVLSPIIFYGGVKIHLPYSISLGAAVLAAVVGLVLLFAFTNLGARKQQPRAEVGSPKIAPPAQNEA